jgi:hypothetical protein
MNKWYIISLDGGCRGVQDKQIKLMIFLKQVFTVDPVSQSVF